MDKQFQSGQEVSKYALIVISILLSIFLVNKIYATNIYNSSNQCSDLVLLFARGSSDNKDNKYINDPFSDDFMSVERVPGAFFQWMEKRIKADYPHIDYKAISIHNSGNMWSANGYPAVGIFNPSTINNMFDAELSWWPAGEYRGSVRSGIDELKGQVNYEVTRCPNQRIVIGGYSQGANVVGDAIFEIPIEQRNLIDNIVLFGDPKFIGAEYNKYNLLDKPKAYPWHRGTAGLRERGINDARIPYVPDDMKYKTISWCHEDDFVCTGFSGLSWGITNHEMPGNDSSIWQGAKGALGDGHTRYPLFGVPEATEEVMANLRSQLAPIEVARGGINPKSDPSKTPYDGTLTNNRPIDLSFVFNTSGNMDDAWSQFFGNGANTMNLLDNQFTNVRYALGGFGESSSTGVSPERVPRMRGFHNLTTSFNSLYTQPYISYGLGGGGDFAEPHGLAIDSYAMRTSWRPDAIKHIVLFTERPPHETTVFDECATRNNFQFENTEYCQLGTKTYSVFASSERCTSIYEVSSSDSCTVTYSTMSHKVTRSIEDIITLARSRGYVVDVIQPHSMNSTDQNCDTACSESKLQYLAESTGGLYLKYTLFDQVALRDAMWQILNHQPVLMRTLSYQPGNLLDFINPLQPLSENQGLQTIPINTPTLLQTTPVSGAQSYVFNFNDINETSPAPSLEATISGQGFLTVRSYSGPDGSGKILSQDITPVNVSDAINTYSPNLVTNLSNVIAERQSGSYLVQISWSDDGLYDKDVVLIRDPISGVLLKSLPASLLSTTIEIDSTFEDKVLIQRISDGGESDTSIVIVEVVTLPEENLPDQIFPDTLHDVIGIPPSAQNEENNTNNEVSPTDTTQSTFDEITGNVGQTNDKVVVQNEGRSNVVLASLPNTTITEQHIVVVQSTQNSPETTVVAGAQDVNTKPQSEVGGINEVNQLFPGENIGAQNNTPEEGSNLLIRFVMFGLPVGVILLVPLFILKKKNKEDDDDA